MIDIYELEYRKFQCIQSLQLKLHMRLQQLIEQEKLKGKFIENHTKKYMKKCLFSLKKVDEKITKNFFFQPAQK